MARRIKPLITEMFALSIIAIKTKSAKKKHSVQLKAGIIREKLYTKNDTSIKINN